jgi:hypothetical protein
MTAHPHCPCTRASLEGLANVMNRLQGRVDAYVLFFKPKEFPAGWERTDLWRSAERIQKVRAIVDVDGLEAELFGAQTSGQTMLFDPRGRLVFAGGLTLGRGHPGFNVGQEQIISLVGGGHEVATAGRVFGCALRTEARKD